MFIATNVHLTKEITEYGTSDAKLHATITDVQESGNSMFERKEQTMKLQCLEATDSNGTELYLFQLEDNSFISVPKEQLEFKPLSPEEIEEMWKETNDL